MVNRRLQKKEKGLRRRRVVNIDKIGGVDTYLIVDISFLENRGKVAGAQGQKFVIRSGSYKNGTFQEESIIKIQNLTF